MNPRVTITRLLYDFIMSSAWRKAKNSHVISTDIQVVVRDGFKVPIRTYRPQNALDTKLATIIFYHGGGFVIGSLKGYHNLMKAFCELTNSQIISVGYRLAPEYPYPTPMHDALDVSQWIIDNPEKFNSIDEFILAGDSAGGNLATVVAHNFKNKYQKKLKGQLLICPTTDDYKFETKSFIKNARVLPLTASTVKWFAKNYTKNGYTENDTNLYPAQHTDFTNLPPALVYTAELDVLRDAGLAYVAKLKQAGIETLHFQQAKEVHNFPIGKIRTDNTEALQQIKNWVKARFSD